MPSIARSSAAAALALAALVCVPPAAAAEARQDWVSVRNVRIGATDVPQAAAFYRAAFGMQEIQRYERPGFLEVILNFGATVDEAKAAETTRIALITRRADQTPDGVSNIVLNVADMDRAISRITEAGGVIEKPPARSALSGRVIAMIRDPAGNRVELIMQP